MTLNNINSNLVIKHPFNYNFNKNINIFFDNENYININNNIGINIINKCCEMLKYNNILIQPIMIINHKYIQKHKIINNIMYDTKFYNHFNNNPQIVS
jgi:hypothetical protein